MLTRISIVALLCGLLLWLSSAFILGRGCVIAIDLSTFKLQSSVEYVAPYPTLTIWRSVPTEYDNSLLELLSTRYANATTSSGLTEIARFNTMWRDGHSWAYTVLVRDRDDWTAWTKENRQLADHAWPRFFRFLDEGDAYRAGTVMWYARESTTVVELEIALANDPEMQHQP